MSGLLTGGRVWLWAVLLRPLKHVVPLSTLVRLVRPLRVHEPGERAEAAERALEAYLLQRGLFPARPPSNCLERSLAAYRVLCLLGRDPRVVVGVRRLEAAGVEGHVWVTLKDRPFGELASPVMFSPVVSFDATGRRVGSADESVELGGVRLA